MKEVQNRQILASSSTSLINNYYDIVLFSFSDVLIIFSQQETIVLYVAFGYCCSGFFC